MRGVESHLAAAFEAELARLELRIAQVWMVLAAGGALGAIAIGATGRTELALGGGAISIAYFAWFSVSAWLLHRRRGGRALRVISTALESILPWTFVVVLHLTEGPAYALGSWVPPMLFSGIIVASTARLRPIEPVVLGIVGGVAFPLTYIGLLRATLPPNVADESLYDTPMQIVRGGTLVIAGCLAMLVSLALRRAIAKAEIIAREQDLFGKYRLGRHIASGGMGTVYEAVYCPEGGFERPVAIKRVHPHLAGEERFMQAFRREAELCARLVHPNIVQVLDFGSVGDSYFLAMEYVDGITLRTLVNRLRAGKLDVPVEVVAYIAREVLAGLSFSHDGARDADGTLLRVIHRDLCPANVLLSRHGAVKITDFGVARALRDAASASTETVAGHFAYMPPEQVRGEGIDPRSDLFALGVILWELLSGRQLFHRENAQATLLAMMTETVPPPSIARSDIDRAWDDFIGKATRREPDERFQSAEEMGRALGMLSGVLGPCPDELALLIERAAAVRDPAPADGLATEVVERTVQESFSSGSRLIRSGTKPT